jgi:hypothetical protein
MSDRAADETKRSEQCKADGIWECPNLIETGGGMKGEQYDCELCGCRVWLDYDDMR